MIGKTRKADMKRRDDLERLWRGRQHDGPSDHGALEMIPVPSAIGSGINLAMLGTRIGLAAYRYSQAKGVAHSIHCRSALSGGICIRYHGPDKYLMKDFYQVLRREHHAVLPAIDSLGQQVTQSGISEWREVRKRGHRIGIVLCGVR